MDIVSESVRFLQPFHARLAGINLPRMNVKNIGHAALEDSFHPASEERVGNEAKISPAAPGNALAAERDTGNTNLPESLAQGHDGFTRFHSGELAVAVVSDGGIGG